MARGNRRETSWLDIPVASFSLGTATSVLNASLTAAELAKRPFTIVRTHLEIFFASDQVAASEIYSAGVGLCVVSDQALAIGVTAVLTPVTDLESDLWLLHKLMFGSFLLGDGTGFIESAGQSISIDSKAMRKVNGDQDVVLTFETGGSGMQFIVGGCLLIKEH